MSRGRRSVPRAGLSRSEVPGAFDVGADAYDALVGANPGYHDHLRISARRMRIPDGGRGLRLLDAGCGTGASTAALLQAAPYAEIIAVDASAGMLEQAAAKSWPDSVRFVHTRSRHWATPGARPVDGILAAYLLRNLADPDAQLRRFRELLRPGRRWPCTSTRYATPQRPRRSGMRSAGPSSFRPAGARPGTVRSTVTCGAASTTSTVRPTSSAVWSPRVCRVHSETVPGWQRNIVHTFLADAPG